MGRTHAAGENEVTDDTARILRELYGLPALDDADVIAAAEALNHVVQAAQQGGHAGLALLLNRFVATVLWEADARHLFVHASPENVRDALDGIERLI